MQNILHDGYSTIGLGVDIGTLFLQKAGHTEVEQLLLITEHLVERSFGYTESLSNIIHTHRFDSMHYEHFARSLNDMITLCHLFVFRVKVCD